VTRSEYYESLKRLARERRDHYGLCKPRVLKSDFRRIFKEEQIRLDYWPGPLRNLRGAYFNDQFGKSIMVAKRLPQEPLLFTLAHEYKHHLTDRDNGIVRCLGGESSDVLEIGAEVFAAEFIYPERLFSEHLAERGVGPGQCNAETLVLLKHQTKTTLSYAALRKRAIWLRFADDSLPTSGWQALEDRLGLGYRRFLRA
jgi:Zn-dependent peptidase ImmA (M78 family)